MELRIAPAFRDDSRTPSRCWWACSQQQIKNDSFHTALLCYGEAGKLSSKHRTHDEIYRLANLLGDALWCSMRVLKLNGRNRLFCFEKRIWERSINLRIRWMCLSVPSSIDNMGCMGTTLIKRCLDGLILSVPSFARAAVFWHLKLDTRNVGIGRNQRYTKPIVTNGFAKSERRACRDNSGRC